MLPTPSVYGFTCVNCAGAIRLLTVLPVVHPPVFERAAQLPLTCPHCHARRVYATAAIVHLIDEELKLASA